MLSRCIAGRIGWQMSIRYVYFIDYVLDNKVFFNKILLHTTKQDFSILRYLDGEISHFKFDTGAIDLKFCVLEPCRRSCDEIFLTSSLSFPFLCRQKCTSRCHRKEYFDLLMSIYPVHIIPSEILPTKLAPSPCEPHILSIESTWWIINRAPFYWHGLSLFQAWINDYIQCGMKLLIYSQSSTMQPLKFGNG